MTRTRLHVAAALAALLLALAAAAPSGAIPTPPSPPAADPGGKQPPVDPGIADGSEQRRLDAARERWAAAAIGSYRMRVRVSCFCGRAVTRPRTVVVRGGRPVRPVSAITRPYATVPRLFARVQAAIDARVALMTVRYDRRGVVASLYVDSSFMIADEERGVAVDRFRRLG